MARFPHQNLADVKAQNANFKIIFIDEFLKNKLQNGTIAFKLYSIFIQFQKFIPSENTLESHKWMMVVVN